MKAAFLLNVVFLTMAVVLFLVLYKVLSSSAVAIMSYMI